MRTQLFAALIGACMLTSSISFAQEEMNWLAGDVAETGRYVTYQAGGPYTGKCTFEFSIEHTDDKLILKNLVIGRHNKNYVVSEKVFDLSAPVENGTQMILENNSKVGEINNRIEEISLLVRTTIPLKGSSLRFYSNKYRTNPNEVNFDYYISGREECKGTFIH